MKKKVKCEVWFQPLGGSNYYDKISLLTNSRLRLLKDKKYQAEYSFGTGIFGFCCWDKSTFSEYPLKGLNAKRKAMHRYDKHYKFPKAVLVASWYE